MDELRTFPRQGFMCTNDPVDGMKYREEPLRVRNDAPVIVFYHPNKEATDYVGTFIRHIENMTVRTGTLEEIVAAHKNGIAFYATAGNSFGLMDGGIDAAFSKQWPCIEKLVRESIAEEYGPEMPIGTALIIRSQLGCPNVVYAPTMQIPQDIRGTDNVYQAARAIMYALKKRYTEFVREAWNNPEMNGMNIVLYMPLLGTGAGRMTLDLAMHQMVRGIRDGYKTWTADDLNWMHAFDMHTRWHEMTGIQETEPPQQMEYQEDEHE